MLVSFFKVMIGGCSGLVDSFKGRPALFDSYGTSSKSDQNILSVNMQQCGYRQAFIDGSALNA